jgi:hypothetical protein
MNQHINACKYTLSALSAYLDNELDVRKRRQVEAHLAQCANCRAELARLRRLSDLLRDSKPLPRAISEDRFAAQVILQLKPQLSPPAWKRALPMLWYFIPAIALGGWIFIHTALFISNLVIMLLHSGTLPLEIADEWLNIFTLLTTRPSVLSYLPPAISQALNYLILQLQTLFLVLVPQFLLVLLYWSWLAGWQIFTRSHQQGGSLTYS